MKRTLANYDIYPKVVKSFAETKVTIRPLGIHASFKQDSYTLEILPKQSSREPLYDYDKVTGTVESNGNLVFSYNFEDEQEYYIRIFKDNAAKKEKAIATLYMYALDEDLYKLTPYRGDLHVHSCFSDGAEDPAIVAANYRKNGFDFFSLTDHHQYKPSIYMLEKYAGKPIDIKLINGEEVHPFENHVHIVNFGGKESVNEMFESDPDKYKEEVFKLLETLNVPVGVNAFEFASCTWAFNKIREVGGLAIFPHPHWLADVFHVPDKLSNALFDTKAFDAFELLGGQTQYENNVQLEYYSEQRAKGNGCPVVGSSDSHGTVDTHWFKWSTTIVFSEDMEVENLIKQIKNFNSVAVESYPNEESRVHGPYRLVVYSKFLLDHYFPLHDELCFEEGRLMKDMYLGDEKAEKLLALVQGRCKGLVDKYWGR